MSEEDESCRLLHAGHRPKHVGKREVGSGAAPRALARGSGSGSARAAAKIAPRARMPAGWRIATVVTGQTMIEPKEYARRRRQLMRMAGPDAIVIVAAAQEHVRNNDAHYPYRQDSDFHYLTGFS